MAGSSSVRGDQTIYHTDNMCFDGTDRGSPMSTDGQLWIGATASDRADNGGHVRLGSLTSPNGTITVGYSAPNITLEASGINDLHTARFIVASSTSGTGANYTSIAAALTAAQATGINSTVFIQPGTYTENLTLVPGINLCAYTCDATTPNVTIAGTLTLTTAGTVSISGIRLQTNGAAALAVTGSAASVVFLNNCYLNFTNATGISYTSSSASSGISIYNTIGSLGTTGIKIFNHTAAGGLTMQNTYFLNGGGSSTASTISAGTLNLVESVLASPITSSGTASVGIFNSTINSSPQNATAFTAGGSGAHVLKFSDFVSGTASALSIGTTVTAFQINAWCTNAASIAGAGTLNYTDVTFAGTSATSAITTTTTSKYISTNFQTLAVQTFVADGTYTPTAGMKYCMIEVVGGGGAGGGAAGGGGNVTVGSGGGAGEYARGVFSAATIGASKAVTIGTAGAGVSGAAGGAGGTTTVGATTISAAGGAGGTSGTSASAVCVIGALGGTGGTGGDFRTPGAPGGTGFTSLTPALTVGGIGANSHYGAGGLGVISGGAGGNAGLGNGSGGSGAVSYGGAAQTGGAGKVGIVVITEYC